MQRSTSFRDVLLRTTSTGNLQEPLSRESSIPDLVRGPPSQQVTPRFDEVSIGDEPPPAPRGPRPNRLRRAQTVCIIEESDLRDLKEVPLNTADDIRAALAPKPITQVFIDSADPMFPSDRYVHVQFATNRREHQDEFDLPNTHTTQVTDLIDRWRQILVKHEQTYSGGGHIYHETWRKTVQITLSVCVCGDDARAQNRCDATFCREPQTLVLDMTSSQNPHRLHIMYASRIRCVTNGVRCDARNVVYVLKQDDERQTMYDMYIMWRRDSDGRPGYAWIYDTPINYVVQNARNVPSFGNGTSDDPLVTPRRREAVQIVETPTKSTTCVAPWIVLRMRWRRFWERRRKKNKGK